jgi:SAM-dependent methyltransferase
MTKKLNIGSGSSRIEGFVNVDCIPGPEVDIVFDIDTCKNTPLPITDSSITSILMSHVLEHLDNPLPAMQELYRVAANGCRLRVRVPHSNNDEAWIDPTHKRPWHWRSFIYFGQPKYHSFDYGYTGDWRWDNIHFAVSGEALHTVKSLEDLDATRNLVHELIVDLTAIKPQRARDKRFMTAPNLGLVLHPFDRSPL